MMTTRTISMQPSGAAKPGTFKVVDTLSRHLEELCRPGALERRKDGERPLLDYVEAEARDLSPEAFGRFMADIYNRIQALLLKSNDNYRRLGGVLAINELVEVKTVGDDAAKTSRLAAMLARALEDADDAVVMDVAAKTLGHLVKSGGAMTSDIVEREVRRAILWCDPKAEPSECRRLAAVLLLKEMAEQAPAVFNVHVKSFIDFIWHPLRDPKLHIREASVQALKACLCLVEKRETRYRVQWYYKLFEQTMRGLNRDHRSQAMPNAESIHGSLLALGELLQHTGEFLLARYREVVETVLRFKDSKEKQIRRGVIILLPRMAAFSPERFAAEYLPRAMVHLLGVLKHQPERGAAFAAIADTAVALAAVGCAAGLESSLPAIAAQVREAITAKTKGKVQCPEALQCVGTLAKALGSLWKPHAQALLEPMMLTSLSDILVNSLTQISEALPDLLEEIQFQMLDLLSLALAKRPFNIYTSQPRFQALSAALASGELQGGQLTKLALQTVGTFEWTSKVSLLEFMRDHILLYTDDVDKDTRQAAVLACCKVLERHATSAGLRRDGMPGAAANVRSTRIVEKVVGRLLVCSVADPSERVRKAVLRALHGTIALDEYLAQAECLRSLFVALNDQSCTVRSLAIRLVGRLADKNPAYVNPALRRHLLQLLTDMEHSPDSKQREESAYLLDCLIGSAPRLIMPYVSPIQKALVQKLRGGMAAQAGALGQAQLSGATLVPASSVASSMGTAGAGGGGSTNSLLSTITGGTVKSKPQDGKASKETSTENGLVKTVLATIGQLAQVSRTNFRPYVNEVMPLVIEAIQDASSMRKRLVAVKTLGQIVENTGTAMSPYQDFPQLLSILLRMLHEGNGPQRKEVMKVLGIVGALDPHTHKTNQASLSGEGKLEKEGVRPLRHNQVKEIINHGEGAVAGSLGGAAATDDFAADLLPASGMVTSSEEYYPTVAINALMRVLRDPSLASQHMNVIASLMSIFKALSLASVPYLPKVLPVLFMVMRASDEALREEMLQQLTRLIGYVRQHIRRFLPDILQLIHEYWATATRTCLALLAELSAALRDDFRVFIPELLPKFVMLFGDAERTNNYDLVRPALAALEALGAAIEEHLHLLLPSLVRLINSGGQASTPLDTSRLALKSMRKLLPRMQLAGYSSSILHPLLKVLDGPHDELRRDALDAMCALAVVLGQDFVVFVPTIRKVVQRYRLNHEWLERLAAKVMQNEPPCMSDADDWEGANGWAQEIDAVAELSALPSAMLDPGAGAPTKLAVNPQNLRRAWESSQRVTKEDWAEWARHFSIELLRESPSPALRACHGLAQVHPSMARELFAAGFVSCWSELDAQLQEQLVRSLEAALASPTIPPEIVTALLNLAEFMEHDDKRLPLHTRTLGALAEKCHAFAKALHYKELEFQANAPRAVEALIHINNQLRQPEAAVGVLAYANKHLNMELKESWYEKLCRWDDALMAYERRMAREAPGTPDYHTALLGKMRCLASLAEWEQLNGLCRVEWRKSEPHLRREMSMLSAHAAWHMGQWDEMAVYVDAVDVPEGLAAGVTSSATGAFLRAVLCARSTQYDKAKIHVERARDLMSTEFAALVGESYERAYTDMIRVQQLAELEEVVEYKSVMERRGVEPSAVEPRLQFIKQLWRDRLKGVQRNVEVWQSLFSVRQLVVPMHEDVDSWLKFAALCRKSGRVKQAKRMLLQLLRYEPLTIGPGEVGYGSGSGAPNVMLAYLKHVWFEKGQRHDALARLRDMVTELPTARTNEDASASAATAAALSGRLPSTDVTAAALANSPGTLTSATSTSLPGPGGDGVPRWAERKRPTLPARAHLRLGMWTWSQSDGLENPAVIQDILQSLRIATDHAPGWAKAWHQWALFNVAVMQHYVAASDPDAAILHVAPAVRGFFRSVSLGQAAGDRTGNLQDILRLMTLWFNHGSYPDVERALQAGFNEVSIDTWLVVIPQIIARIHTNNPAVRGLIHQLLIKIGRHHPQALMYPLLVATKSQSAIRRTAAFDVLDHIRQHSAPLVEQAQLVSHELIRMAILWHEMWHEGLEEASRLYFGESNVEGMLNTLLPLHDMMDRSGPTTLKEIAFIQAYGRELAEAYEWLMKYKTSRKEAELHQAWDLYYHVFKRINKQLHSLATLELQYVAPALVKAQGMELAVPGTYIAGEPLVQIAAFAPQLHVISSKQRPRKLTIHGGDGAEYMFLLKGHEDLRQDERVMQLFGLVNTMLAYDRTTAERDLTIARYAVIPLSPNSGLIGWVPNCDTLHALIREYREARKIPLNWEHRLMLGMAPDYDHLTVIQKVEVFEYALDSTSGEDLHKVLWLKSRNSEVWLDRRTNYTRSAAVMSMVGYILGLGDRHPSNLMLDRYSGKLLHIDFGDCFEASMNREKFPEKVPFRLTRMMIKAMEVSGIEGNFRTTCENVMRVLRLNKESVTAMLEAFVHDPLINWRLLNPAEAATEAALTREHDGGGHGTLNGVGPNALAGHHHTSIPSPPRREARERELREARDQLGDANEVLNSRAVEVMKRMSDKLMGRDFMVEGLQMPTESDSVAAQVNRLILQAISHENLCQSYIGWCPFW